MSVSLSWEIHWAVSNDCSAVPLPDHGDERERFSSILTVISDFT